MELVPNPHYSGGS